MSTKTRLVCIILRYILWALRKGGDCKSYYVLPSCDPTAKAKVRKTIRTCDSSTSKLKCSLSSKAWYEFAAQSCKLLKYDFTLCCIYRHSKQFYALNYSESTPCHLCQTDTLTTQLWCTLLTLAYLCIITDLRESFEEKTIFRHRIDTTWQCEHRSYL